MELELATDELKKVQDFIKFYKNHGWMPSLDREISVERSIEAIKTVLEALENSIPKKKVEDNIKTYKNMCARLGLAIDKDTLNMFDYKIKALQGLLEDKKC